MAKKSYIEIDIDAIECQAVIDRMRSAMTPEQFERAMYGIMREVSKRVKRTLGNVVPQDYNVKAAEVRAAVMNGRLTAGGGGAGCVIPVKGPRKHIGGTGRGFPAYSKKVHGYEAYHTPPYPVSTMVYRGVRATLPMSLASYGGQKPFRNIPSKLNTLTFTRGGKDRLPIYAVMGIAVPQMPLNRSEPAVQEDISEFLMRRMEARLQAMIANGR